MSTSSRRLPESDRLETCLAPAFCLNGTGRPRVLKREPSPYSTTFPCEIVTLELPNNQRTDLFCKYSAGIDYTGFGHRGGPAYELAVYREVLQPIGISAPALWGGQVDCESGDAWLALEYLRGALGVGKMYRSGAMIAAAQWAGRFHRSTAMRKPRRSQPRIKVYTRRYYLGWVRRTVIASRSLPRRLPWLEAVCQQAGSLMEPLLNPPHSIIHGEFYPHNVLYYEERVYPVDWESAARAAGEIDLASLIEDWSAKIVRDCIAAYQLERWSSGAPADFTRRLLAARLYLCFRWLGDHDWTNYPGLPARLRQLRRLGREMGVL